MCTFVIEHEFVSLGSLAEIIISIWHVTVNNTSAISHYRLGFFHQFHFFLNIYFFCYCSIAFCCRPALCIRFYRHYYDCLSRVLFFSLLFFVSYAYICIFFIALFNISMKIRTNYFQFELNTAIALRSM